jgi:hypothetical protein
MPVDDWEEPPEKQDEEDRASVTIPDLYQGVRRDKNERTVRELWRMVVSGDIVLEPDFQRQYCWDDRRASRFIESLLLNIPVPPIFLAEQKDGTWVVIDGHQRLASIFRFFMPRLEVDRALDVVPTEQYTARGVAGMRSPVRQLRTLVLKDLKILETLNGIGCQKMSHEDLDKIWNYKMTTVEFPKEVPADMTFEIFARLNQGSMAINYQELRNCLFRGPYNRRIRKLAEDRQVLEFFGKKTADKRMKDCERVLAFFAFAHRLADYEPPRYRFLDQEMEERQNANRAELEKYESEFLDSMKWVENVFDAPHALRLFKVGDEKDPNGRWERRNDLIYEVEMVGFYKHLQELQKLDEKLNEDDMKFFLLGLKHSLVSTMTDPVFIMTLTHSTSHKSNVQKRFSLWTGTLKECIENPEKTIAKARRIDHLRKRSETCSRCPTRIESFEDTVLTESGEIAHRYCCLKK